MLKVHADLIDRAFMMAGPSLHVWNLTREEVAHQINQYKLDFIYLTGHFGGDASLAYQSVREATDKGYPKGFSIPNPPPDAFETLLDFFGVSHLPDGQVLSFNPRRRPWPLPEWFRVELANYLSYPPRRTVVHDVAFWATSKLLTDSLFMHAVSRLRFRWNIEPDTDGLSWREAMNAAHSQALAFCHEHSIHPHNQPRRFYDGSPGQEVTTYAVILDEAGGRVNSHEFDDYWRRRGEVRFLKPFDQRKLESYEESDRVTYGLPIYDYETDIATLAWLAGGTAAYPTWRIWAELLLWDFQDSAYADLPVGTQKNFWPARGIRLGTFGYKRIEPRIDWQEWEPYGRLTALPDAYRTMNGWKSHDEAADKPGVEFLSRWLDVSEFPPALQPFLVYSIIRTWGKYEPVPAKHRLTAWLEKLLRPLDTYEVPRLSDFDPDDLMAVDKVERAQATMRKRRSRL